MFIEKEKAVLSYRQANGIVIPYLKQDFDLENTIRSVTIGPLIEKGVAEKTIKCLLNEHDINIPVRHSNLPVRY